LTEKDTRLSCLPLFLIFNNSWGRKRKRGEKEREGRRKRRDKEGKGRRKRWEKYGRRKRDSWAAGLRRNLMWLRW